MTATMITLQYATLITLGIALIAGGIVFGKIIQWQTSHDKQDNDRFLTAEKERKEIKSIIETIRTVPCIKN